jgi:uncharacterized membrane protein YozB (DUF420 family)
MHICSIHLPKPMSNIMETTTITSNRLVSERRFYSAMAIAILMSVLVGFGRSFFLRPLFPDRPSPSEPLFYIHGAAFTLWIIVFLVQVTLISRANASTHKKIGLVSAFLVVVMVVLGIMGALTAASRSTGFVGIPVPALQFLAVPLFDMIIFPAFIAMAYIRRHNAQSHKRWMVLATLNLITAAIARWPVVDSLGPLAYFGVTDLFVVALAVWDFRSLGRIHSVTLWGGLLMILSQPLRLIISGTSAWMVFAQWATGQ